MQLQDTDVVTSTEKQGLLMKISGECSIEKAKDFLQRDVLRNIVILKMIENYPKNVHCYHSNIEGAEGICILLDTPASPYDTQTYPEAEFVGFFSVMNKSVAYALVENLPAINKAVFKLSDQESKDAVSDRFELKRQRAVISYTGVRTANNFHPEIITSNSLDSQELALFMANGYSEAEIRTWFDAGAFSTTIYDNNTATCSCFCYPN